MKKFLFKRKTITLTIGMTFLTLSLAAVAFSQAIAITTNDFVPFALVAFVPCANGGAGENVLVQGTLHIEDHITINGNRATIKTYVGPQGATGVGQTTGDTYRGVGNTQETDTIPLTNGAFEFTFVNNFRMIGQGPNNNLQVHQTIHETIDANGNVTTVVDNTSVDCN
ncbi:MAG TPA: hypothetical protein VIX17_01590 [Pyrinomonadaceae bacterium]|jgi:hypothetical protein